MRLLKAEEARSNSVSALIFFLWHRKAAAMRRNVMMCEKGSCPLSLRMELMGLVTKAPVAYFLELLYTGARILMKFDN